MRALSRKTASRKSLLRNLATSLVLYERIETTEAKAKEVKGEVEHLLAIAKKNDLATRRRLLGYFFDKNATKKVLEVLLPRYENLSSGFIKSYRKGHRLGDGAMVMILELKKVELKIEDKAIIKEGKDDSQDKGVKATGQATGKSDKSDKASGKTGSKNSAKTTTSK